MHYGMIISYYMNHEALFYLYIFFAYQKVNMKLGLHCALREMSHMITAHTAQIDLLM